MLESTRAIGYISIHAPREAERHSLPKIWRILTVFQSTLRARRSDIISCIYGLYYFISIHAPREAERLQTF